MNKKIIILFFLIYSIQAISQIQKINIPDSNYNNFYVSIYNNNAFVYLFGSGIASQKGNIYIKKEKKWYFNQAIPHVTMSGSHMPGINRGILYEDNLYVVKNILYSNSYRDVLFIYSQDLNNYKFYVSDSILLDTASSIANFAVNKDWIFIRDYWGDFSDFPNVKNINSYYFFHRENGKWIKKTKISYESNNSATYTSARFAINKNYAYAGQGKKIVIFKRKGDKWEIHQYLTDANCPAGFGNAVSNISVSEKGTWLITMGNGGATFYIFKLIDDKYSFAQEISKPFEQFMWSFYFNITEGELLGGFTDYNSERGIIVLYVLKNGTWVKKNLIHPPASDTTYLQFGYSIDRYGETVITNAPDETSYPIQKNSATYIFQIPARDTLRAGICEGESYTFNDTVIYDAGHYTDTLLASYGVDSVVQLYLTVYPKEQIEIDTVLCDNQQLIIGDSVLTEEGIYTITLQNQYGCDSLVTAKIEYDDIEVVDSITADYGCQNGEIKLSVEGKNPPYAFNWSGGQTGEYINGLSYGNYNVTITSHSGCVYDYEYEVGDSVAYLIPNAFFPSGQEELNVIFKPYTAKDVHILSTEIYDRWGEKVFSGGEDEFWDGTFKGKLQSPGVYLYRIVIDSPCGEEVKTGQVVLLR